VTDHVHRCLADSAVIGRGALYSSSTVPLASSVVRLLMTLAVAVPDSFEVRSWDVIQSLTAPGDVPERSSALPRVFSIAMYHASSLCGDCARPLPSTWRVSRPCPQHGYLFRRSAV